MAWHRTHRPKQIKELHLTEVREALQQMMKQGNFPQVLLFAGPKGTGKTSASRIIGNLLNDPKNSQVVDHAFFGKKAPAKKEFSEPDTDSEFARRVYTGQSYVVQEMDAASYRGIDDVRSLKERVMLPPQEGKIAVYILDEAHMFTTEAFNALLKLLEEPPAHAVFILATTELHKIPETITSRSTQVTFRKATQEELLAALTLVSDQEKLKYDQEALLELALRADGSFRDAVKLLEVAAQSGTVSLESVAALLGQNSESLAKELIDQVVEKDTAGVTELIGRLRSENVQETYFYKTLFNFLHRCLLQDLGAVAGEPPVSAKVAQFLLQELLKADLQQYSPLPFLALELHLLAIIERAQQQSGSAPPAKKKIKKAAEPDLEPLAAKEAVAAAVTATLEPSPASLTAELDDRSDEELRQFGKNLVEQWEQFLEAVHQRNATLAALLRSSKPVLGENGVPQVGVYYRFHQEQLQQQKYMTLIQDCAKDIIGVSLPLEISLQHAPSAATLVEMPEAKRELSELAEEALL